MINADNLQLIRELKGVCEGLVKRIEELEAEKRDSEILDLVDVEKILNISHRTSFNWIKAGILPTTMLGGKHFITRAKLMEALEATSKMNWKGGRYA